jgi:hypothetical protein
MKLAGWMVVVAVATGMVVTARGGCLTRKAPDEKLASRFEAICDIARENSDTPVAGVRALGGYLGTHLDDMTGELGGTIAMIEKIPDDREHDLRARKAKERMFAPLRACQRDLDQFFDAVEADPTATAIVNRAFERLGRTLDIILSSNGLRDVHDLRGLPARLEQLVR